MTLTEIENNITKLATEVLDGDSLKKFLALPLKSQACGIWFFAAIAGNEEKVVEFAKLAYEQLS